MAASSDFRDLADGLHRVPLADGRCTLVKRRRAAPPGFFAAEARGLALLAGAGGLRVPRVFDASPGWLAMEDLGSGAPAPGAWSRAGAALARQHDRRSGRFGLEHDGWCGDSVQANTPMDDGHAFFARCRLLPQARLALEAALLETEDMAAVERVCARLRERVPAQPPALLHGDLWTGNLHACADGEFALVDAGAAHYGWAEAELAMLVLFDAPPRAFFAAYEEAAGIDGGWRDRAPLYNLYHLLNHLSLFGSGYLAQVRAVLRAYG